jgi:excinuclease ABC subunit A
VPTTSSTSAPAPASAAAPLIAQGTAAELARNPDSLTGRFLAHPLQHPLQPRRKVNRAVDHLALPARICTTCSVDIQVPLQRLVAVTGVSGSGKSTLARDVLLANVHAIVATKVSKAGRDALAAGTLPPLTGCTGISGFMPIDRVLEVDQTPIGKTPRSCPATYIGFWDAIRKLFTETLEAKARGYAAARFSFNTGDGRCPACEGPGPAHHRDELPARREGALRPVPRPALQPRDAGRQLARQEHRRRAAHGGGRSGGVLRQHAQHRHPLQLLKDVGLGYLTLGQPSAPR